MDRAHPTYRARAGDDAFPESRTRQVDQRLLEDRSTAMRASGRSRLLAIGHAALWAAVGTSVSGCVSPAPQAQPAAPAPAPSYDGHYEGRVEGTGASVGMSRLDCETDPRFAVEVRGSRFSIVQPHPRVATAVPTLRDRTTVVYDAAIRPDGTIVGTSGRTNATMEGRVSGARMSGQIYGLLCYYAFTAERA